MTDAELLEQAAPIIQRTRETCGHVLELVDQLGERQAFEMMQTGRLRYSFQLFKRMLEASAGADDAEMFWIALQVDKENP